MNRTAMLRIHSVLVSAAEGKLPPGVDLFDMYSWKRELSCGTAACAIGLYIIAYPENGLTLGKEWEEENFFDPVLGELRGFKAVAAHLEISHTEAIQLFDPMSYPPADLSPQKVLERLEEFLHDND